MPGESHSRLPVLFYVSCSASHSVKLFWFVFPFLFIACRPHQSLKVERVSPLLCARPQGLGMILNPVVGSESRNESVSGSYSSSNPVNSHHTYSTGKETEAQVKVAQ